MKIKIRALAAIMLLTAFQLSGREKADIIISGGTVYNGSGAEAVVADVVIKGERIIYVGQAGRRFQADTIIHADGSIVCPGFIDPHSHQEGTLLKTRSDENYLRMGVTTVFTGMCGGSQYPLSEYFAKLEKQGIGPNTASFTGHGALRSRVMGEEARPSTVEEVDKMKELFSKDLESGSFGLSTGLFYVPGCFAEIDEVYELARFMAPYGGMYTTHVRYENKDGIGLQASIEEALNVGRVANVPVNISHIKCLGKSVWGQSDAVIAMIEKAQREGVKATADQYPYQASGTSVTSALFPAWCRDGGNAGLRKRLADSLMREKIKAEVAELVVERGGAETILFTSGKYKGRTLSEVASEMCLDPVDAAIELAKKGSPGLATFVMSESDIRNFMKQPWVMNCTDGGDYGGHPRPAGSFAEKIQKYVVNEKVISIGDMIRRSTGLVAETYKIKDRGRIEAGCFADVLVFKPEEIRANATFKSPKNMATGFQYVIVNGTITVDHDHYTGALKGKVIRRNAQ